MRIWTDDLFDAFTKTTDQFFENVPYTRKVKDNGNDYSVKIDIPGFEKEEIDIEVVDNILNIKAKSAEDSKKFALYVPNDIDKNNIGASLKNGQLTVTLPKLRPQTNVQKVRIV